MYDNAALTWIQIEPQNWIENGVILIAESNTAAEKSNVSKWDLYVPKNLLKICGRRQISFFFLSETPIDETQKSWN